MNAQEFIPLAYRPSTSDEPVTPEQEDLAAWLILRTCPAQYEVLTEMLGIPDPILT